jgi:hypothetical protein
MAIAHYYKHFNLLGLMITNLEWLEIKSAWLFRQNIGDQLDLIGHIFKLKSQAFLQNIF